MSLFPLYLKVESLAEIEIATKLLKDDSETQVYCYVNSNPDNQGFFQI